MNRRFVPPPMDPNSGKVDPTLETAYWRDNFASRPYADKDAVFDDYAPAYTYGIDSSVKYHDRDFDDIESELSRGWDKVKGKSALAWDRAREATRDAWDRVRNQF